MATGTLARIAAPQQLIPGQRRTSGPVDPLRPPRSWFDNPQLSGPTPMTYTSDGRVYGHMALWRSCHIGYLNGVRMMCLKPPRDSSGYRYFRLGYTETSTGEQLAIGKITVGAPLATVKTTPWGAISHYDNAALTAAVVVPHEDRWGLALAGARAPDTTDVQWAMARRSPVSGDWRLLDSGYQLIAALGVNSPGYPVPEDEQALLASAGSPAILAAGIMPSWEQLITWTVADAVRSTMTPALAAQMGASYVRL